MLKVLGDRVLVALPPKAETQDETTGYTVQDLKRTESGLFVAKPTDVFNVEIATYGIVTQLGEKSQTVDLEEVLAAVGRGYVELDEPMRPLTFSREAVDAAIRALAPAPFDVQVGDCIVFPPSAGERLLIDGSDVEYVILRESDIIGIVEPKEHAA
jgi:hypothetical protein